MSDADYNSLKLENQLCFPLYVCSKEIVRRYTPYLEPLGLTYTQYITMMALWEYGTMSVTELGDKISLDSGTLTPLLKKLEDRGYVVRVRNKRDERSVLVRLTEDGNALREEARGIPEAMGSCIDITMEDALELQRLLRKLMNNLDENTV
ncbi:MAG: MarR family transcriptional regulator [Thermoplasmata archaeon]|jgi:DNA-binding MarR family transcriptional regulator|nr:MarR family transcriptional regulator [Thermoplasmata archaeon]